MATMICNTLAGGQAPGAPVPVTSGNPSNTRFETHDASHDAEVRVVVTLNPDGTVTTGDIILGNGTRMSNPYAFSDWFSPATANVGAGYSVRIIDNTIPDTSQYSSSPDQPPGLYFGSVPDETNGQLPATYTSLDQPFTFVFTTGHLTDGTGDEGGTVVLTGSFEIRIREIATGVETVSTIPVNLSAHSMV